MRLSLIVLFLLLGTPAFASDGVLEINQACATSTGGCFAGDAIGFPVTISQSGSYRLTGNLSLPANTTAIDILANGVELDLGGFAIVGPNVCNNFPVNSCTTAFGASGIRATQPGQFGVAVRNGSVMGMGGIGVEMVALDQSVYSMVVEDLLVVGNGSAGISLGGLSRVRRCRVHRNLGSAIFLQVLGLAEDNDIYANGLNGLLMQGGQAVRNHIRFNGSSGMVLGAATVTLLRENSLSANIGLNDLPSGGSSTGDNLCNGVRC